MNDLSKQFSEEYVKRLTAIHILQRIVKRDHLKYQINRYHKSRYNSKFLQENDDALVFDREPATMGVDQFLNYFYIANLKYHF